MDFKMLKFIVQKRSLCLHHSHNQQAAVVQHELNVSTKLLVCNLIELHS